MIDDDRLAAHRAKGAHGTIDAADQHVRGAAKYFLGARPLHFENLGEFIDCLCAWRIRRQPFFSQRAASLA